jgi:hypothetical protein
MTRETLRLQLAEFNNFIIEQYLSNKNIQVEKEPQKFLFGVFYNLSLALSSIGKVISLPAAPNARDISIIKDSLEESYRAAFLIERSANMNELTEQIMLINTLQLVSIIENVEKFGSEFNKPREVINEETAQIKYDYKDYFNADESFKYRGAPIDFETAVNFLKKNSSLPNLKKAFTHGERSYKFLFDLHFDMLNSKNIGYTDNLLKNTLDALNLVLITLSYIEPFFEPAIAQTNTFQKSVKKILITKASLYKNLPNLIDSL